MNPFGISLALAAVIAFFPSNFLRAADTDIDYGAAKVNSMGKTQGTKLGGEDDFDVMALRDFNGPTGVPVGGIGVGCFDYAPTGDFTRIAINNWHSEGGESSTVEHPAGSFLALWRNGRVQLLNRDGPAYAGMASATHTVYKGLFPVAECRVDDAATIHVWSGLVPQDVKDSSLPLAWIEVDIANPGDTPQETGVAFSWQDVIARGIRDFPRTDLLKGLDASVWTRERMLNKMDPSRKSTWLPLPRVATTADAFTAGNFQGIRQFCAPLQPVYKTYQNYNNEVALMAEQIPGATITTLPAYAVNAPGDAWKDFVSRGSFADAGTGSHPLYDPAAATEMASAVAVHLTLQPHETRTVRFLVAWFQPQLIIDPATADPDTYLGALDHARFYHNSFSTLADLVTYAAAQRENIRAGIAEWQDLILASSYPDWLKFKVINSAYTMYTNAILNKEGDFTVMEGGMGGLAGTMDQRLSSHPFYQKFFPQLDRSELELFGHTPGAKGQILHFVGHYYWGLATRDGKTPVPDNSMLDNTGGWLVQLAKTWQQTGDRDWLIQFQPEIGNGLRYLKESIKSKAFQIPTGLTTYDDFWHPPVYAYNAGSYPAFLKAGAVLSNALGDSAQADACTQQETISAQDAVKALWNGKFFAYGCDLDGQNRRDDIMFSGQLAGQFVARYCTWGDVYPMDKVRSSLVAQMQSNIKGSPDYYAPKVWLLSANKAMNDPKRPNDKNTDSTCWPFYLESYTAMPAIQAGYVEDGLSIMRHIQLVHLRNGWEWSQNLWRPGELTYMTAPVSWFITDVLAGAGLDLPNHTLYLAPVMTKDQQAVKLPLFYPRFWAVVTADRTSRKLTLEIKKVFPGPDMAINRVIAQPAGIPTDAQKIVSIPTFQIVPGAMLDLSANWNDLIGGDFPEPVLPRDTRLGL